MISISAVAPVRSSSPNSQSSKVPAASSSETHSFASHLKASSHEEEEDHSTTAPQSVKKALPKDEKEARRQKSSTAAGILSVPVLTQQVQDPRSLLVALPKHGDQEEGTAAGDDKIAADSSSKMAESGAAESKAAMVQKGQVAFSVALPKTAVPEKTSPAAIPPVGGASAAAIAPADKGSHSEKNSAGKQHSDTSDSDDSSSSSKAASLASTPKEQTFAPVANAINTAPNVVTGVQQTQPAPYADAHLGKINQPAAAAEVVKTADLPPTPVSRPPQSIDLKVAGADNSQVDVRVSQRAGDVQVTVRTPDGDLAQSLRQHLPELSDRLAQTGVSGDIWHPATAQASADTASNQESWNSDQQQAQQQQQHQQRNQNGRFNQPQEEGNPSNWRNEFSSAEKEDR